MSGLDASGPPPPLPVRLDDGFGAPLHPPPPVEAPAVAAFADEAARATQALLDRAAGRAS